MLIGTVYLQAFLLAAAAGDPVQSEPQPSDARESAAPTSGTPSGNSQAAAREAALARALREPPGSPSFYRALGRPDLAGAGEHRILGRRVAMMAGAALWSVGVLWFLYSLRDYKPALGYGSSSGGPSDQGNEALVPYLVVTGGVLFACGVILRKDPLDDEQRDALVRDFLRGPHALANASPYAFVDRTRAGVGIRGSF